MEMIRSFHRQHHQTRPIELIPEFYDYTEGSCLVKYGRTHVLCVATIEESAPPHLRGTGRGWITAEYNMLPRSSRDRIKRERAFGSGRSQEIQRLIGRSLRSVCDLSGWGERSIVIDCDVLQADGGTRTASITGAFVALAMAFRFLKLSGRVDGKNPFPIKDFVSAISVGLVDGNALVDLDYAEDSRAQADMNIVMTAAGELIEVQGTGEDRPFSRKQFESLLDLAAQSCQEICERQKKILGFLNWQ